MTVLPLNIGTIHFVGIGGIGMSGIAEILHNLNYSIQGSDIADNANVRRLRRLGIDISVGHAAENIREAEVVVISSAVKPNNIEILEARSRLIPVVPRAEMLAEIMRLKWGISVAGTHGKTTTTSIIASILDAGRFDPTVINGGIINAYGTNARLGSGEWIIVEADESDGTFTKLPSTIAVVTNIDAEHLDYYGDFETLKIAFVKFVQNIPFYGFATMCIDDAEVQALIPQVSDRRVITYGFSPQADFRAIDVSSNPAGSSFTVVASNRGASQSIELGRFAMPMVGDHNIRNTLAAIAIATEMGVHADVVREALGDFSGVKRRFTQAGTVNEVTIIDDYGHHPVEISAVLAAARTSSRRNVIAVVQPHRYTRLRDLFDDFCTCFNDADTVIVADIYAAGETPIEGYDRDTLIEGIRSRGHRNVLALENANALPKLISEIARPYDYVICLGAGNITAWANDLPGKLSDFWRTDNEAATSVGGV
ncbi:MAG: UDP-N-acetylmuramate--L-alanine ligase [Alphaproteobacteria bacterium MarineAlpha11_Bin1]|nr:MAG: UDP-N-acetylmuramate--L-alanine ligase [Alphaproteobacteria bacterium MarineAlpha11_Bin1]|tara:strand:+ start:3034 stop:4479 length:1446 start_codon:yes stop_codon:yes gene_type:complete